MKFLLSILVVLVSFVASSANPYTYSFNNTPISEAMVRISKEHPEINISFIYKDLDNYKTSAKIHEDDAYEALRRTIGLNPVSVIKKDNNYYVEALQHGKFRYMGQAIGSDNEPVVAATVMLLAPKDSTVITYGITDAEGRFSIPCDRQDVIGKLSCMGYKTVYKSFPTFNVGKIVMPEKTIALKAMTVEGDNAKLYADKSVYLPTTKQKNASQTGTDLLSHMAIPQLGVITDNSVVTNSGRPVKLFINYLPATENDLMAMRVGDVKRVEYLEYPSDPRLQGNPFVVNFITQRYEYGGYAKLFGRGTILNGHQEGLTASVRMQYKKMTYDLVGSANESGSKHDGENLKEVFRLPQDDGSIREFERLSRTTGSESKGNNYYLVFKGTYNSENIQASSLINGNLNRKPTIFRTGTVNYTADVHPSTEYTSDADAFSKYILYNGYYFFVLPKNNSITFTPSYSFSHTEQSSLYSENSFQPIENSARDNTNNLSGNLRYRHDFGSLGSLTAFAKGSYYYSRTFYSGTANALDRAKTSRMGIGLNYDVTVRNVRAQVGLGWDWDRFRFNTEIDRRNAPSFDVSLQFSPSRKQSLAFAFEYDSWLPSPNFKSDQIIESSPFLKYTGNPNLFPAKEYTLDLSYTWIPNNNYSLSAFSWAWIVTDRYVYDYVADGSGVLRTIKQPMGSYAQGLYGISGTARFLDRSLVATGRVSQLFNHNGQPYNVNHFHTYFSALLRYYYKNWNFALSYVSKMGSWDGMMNGIWNRDKSKYYLSVGWSNSNLNVTAMVMNIGRWNWESTNQVMNSQVYSTDETFINGDSHAFVRLTATYILDFGKKVKRGNEPQTSGSASSGILK